VNVLDILQTTLLDILYELRDSDLPLILGGGYGLYLKQHQVASSNVPLLLNAIPPPRATNDLDIFLRTELKLFALRDQVDEEPKG